MIFPCDLFWPMKQKQKRGRPKHILANEAAKTINTLANEIGVQLETASGFLAALKSLGSDTQQTLHMLQSTVKRIR